MNRLKRIQQINEAEFNDFSRRKGVTSTSQFTGSWHEQYKDSAWIYVGSLSFDMNEGDVLTVFSQCGEIEEINLVRSKENGSFRGFGFIKYHDQRSTILAVDNFNGVELLGRNLRVDHKLEYEMQDNSAHIVPELAPRSPSPDTTKHSSKRHKKIDPYLKAHEKSRKRENKKNVEGNDDLDEEDPMADYIRRERRREQKRHKKKSLKASTS